jgi:membrane-bound serine protease (ClpP class)
MKTPLRALAALLLVSATASQTPSQEPTIRLIAMPRDGKGPFARSISVVRPLDEELLRDWRDAKEEARAAGAQVIILEITASSGRRNVAASMAEDFADLRAAGVRVVAFVPEKATGPAALLALEADTLVLSADAQIGDADPATMEGTAGTDQAAARRDILAQAHAAARRAGHPIAFVDAMIDPDVEIYEVRRPGAATEFVTAEEIDRVPKEGVSRELVNRKGETLVMNALQARRYGFPVKTAETRDDLLRALSLEDRPIASGEILKLKGKDTGGASWFHFDWTIILLALGILFLILELKTPGIGLNGILGIASLAGYFLVNAGAGGVDASITIGLLLIGFLLLLVEVVFLPGFGVPGILGVVLILLSIYAASIGLPGDTLREQLIPDSDDDFLRLRAWLIQFFGSVVLATFGAILIAPRLHRLPLFNRAFLAPALAGAGSPAATGHHAGGVSPQGRVHLDVGARGTSETDLRPAGIARIREHRVDVVTDGEYLARGTRVIVTAIEGHRVVVKADRGAAS